MSAIEYYDHTTFPPQGAAGSSAAMRAELETIEAAFGKLPTLAGNGGKIAVVNAGGTALEATSTPALGAATGTSFNGVTITPVAAAVLTLANGSTLATSGAYSATFTLTAATNVTLPTTGTLATLAGAEILSNKTLTSPAINSPTGITATNISNTPAAGVTELEVQGALNGLETRKAKSGANTDITSLNGANTAFIPVRQTVLSGPVDTSGLSAFGGATGGTTVTASGTLIATAANGFVAGGQQNRIGSIVNPSWTGLSTNGEMYLYLDISADGVCTTGSGTLAPTYRFGGADVTTSGQFTFNTQEMSGKVGNGSAAVQTYRVYVGQVTVAGGVVTAIVWYAIQGRYVSGYTNTLPAAGTSVIKSHNLGTMLCVGGFRIKCLSSEHNIAVGEIENNPWMQGGTSNSSVIAPSITTAKSFRIVTGSTLSVGVFNRDTGVGAIATAASWAFEMWAERSF